MEKNILILNGSPRRGGNTESLVDAFIIGAKSAGHRAHKANLQSMNIKPCVGCYQCAIGKGDPCVQNDDMAEIYDQLDLSDVVVFASPLYWWQVTAQMKMVIDRIFAVAASNGMNMPQKEVALIIAAESAREENFAQIIPYYQTCLSKNLGWIDRGMVLAGGVNMPGDVQKTPYLQEAQNLGASL